MLLKVATSMAAIQAMPSKSGQAGIPPDLPVCLMMQEQTGSSRLHASHCGLLKMFPIADILEMTFECPLNGAFPNASKNGIRDYPNRT